MLLSYSTKCKSKIKNCCSCTNIFAVQTRKQEISEKEYTSLTEEEKRFYQRNLTRKGNYSLNQTAKKAGVKILINFTIVDIKDYIMEKLQMILLRERIKI